MIELLKILLPFLKESLLSGDSLKGWAKRNRTTVLWLVMLTGMLLAVLWLSDTVIRERLAQTQYKGRIHDLEIEQAELQAQLLDANAELAELRKRDLQTRTWMDRCDLAYPRTAQAACPVPHVVPIAPTRHTKSKTLHETVSDILGK